MAELFGTSEKDLRDKTAGLLAEAVAGVKKPRRKVLKETTAAKLRKLAMTKKQMRTKSARRPREVKVKGISAKDRAKGFPLHERLLARTEPDGWYTHAQLLRLLPETTKGSLHALLYAKLPAIGWLERRALTEFPRDRWLNAKSGEDAMKVMTQPGYVYRIGAQQAEMRARAREKDKVLRSG